MIRTALGCILSSGVLLLAWQVALVQVENYRVAAELDRLAVATEWNERRSSGIEPELMRFEFDLEAEHTRRRGSDVLRPSR